MTSTSRNDEVNEETFSDISMHNKIERVDRDKYVAQLEKRLLEQEQLIFLLNEKIARLETAAESTRSFSNVLQVAPSQSVGGGELRKSAKQDVYPSFVGSRKSEISSVPSARYSQFFVTRLNPSLSSIELAEDLLKVVSELSSVRCCKLRTRHSTYSSFHVVVPEIQKHLVSCGEAWPEGTFVKVFSGRLLQSYVIESYDSESKESVTVQTPFASSQKGALKKSSCSADSAVKAKSSATTLDSATKSRPPAVTTKKSVSTRVNQRISVSSATSTESASSSKSSPKNLRPTRSAAKNR